MEMTIESVYRAIAKLEAIDPYDEFAYEKAFMAYKIVNQLPILVYDINVEIAVFRARTHFDDILYKKMGDVSLAPHNEIKKFARCNRPFQSKFYSGENRPTSYIELVNYWCESAEIGDRLFVTIGRWRVKRPFSSLIITTPDPENRVSDFDREHGVELDKFINKYQGEAREAMTIFYRYIFDRFRNLAYNDPLTYIITSAYCNMALFDLPFEVDAIHYPSVPFQGDGVNFAFNNKFIIHNNIELIGAIRDEMLVYRQEDGLKGFRQVNNIEAKSIDSQRGIIAW